jgi:DNA-binding PadR family transcriptional regulator
MTDPYLDKLNLELRRGVITLAVLCQLKTEQYGYSLISQLQELGLQIDQGTLYPLLRRLADEGLLESDWRLEDPRPRRYYWISSRGENLLPQLKKEWNNLVKVMKRITT